MLLGAASAAMQDPAEPANAGAWSPAPKPVVPASPPGAIPMEAVDPRLLLGTIQQLVACGTRSSLSSWTDPRRGIGCARNYLAGQFRDLARLTHRRLQVVVDSFEATSPRTANKPAHLENVYAILPGTDPALAKTVFLVSGHFDSIPSNVMDAETDAPGADDDASGTAVSLECARLLAGGRYRATLLFAALSGEEQGLLGGKRLLAYLQQNGYTVGGFLNNDIVGADFAPGAPHRVRVFSGGGPEGADSPSRELARSIEEIDGRSAIRLIFRPDRLGRGGDHLPFIAAGLPAVRFTEPLEDYHHQHQTPRVEKGIHYGDLIEFLNLSFLRNVVRDNAEVLRVLALAPAPPSEVTLSGAVSPDAKLAWSGPDDPERAGFEILWRETTDPRWSVLEFTPTAGEHVLAGISTDNYFFAVRAVGKNGARSIAVAALPKGSAARQGREQPGGN